MLQILVQSLLHFPTHIQYPSLTILIIRLVARLLQPQLVQLSPINWVAESVCSSVHGLSLSVRLSSPPERLWLNSLLVVSSSVLAFKLWSCLRPRMLLRLLHPTGVAVLSVSIPLVLQAIIARHESCKFQAQILMIIRVLQLRLVRRQYSGRSHHLRHQLHEH